jgi:eukaryotic-like serine/threonine-protein kinase
MSEQGPTVFGGRYELHRRLARGGMAEVFLARDQLLDRPVAVKVLFAEFATDPSFVERFRREAQAAANLSHPNIVGVYDWGREGSTYYIVMEYVEGRSLSDIIRNDGPLSPSRVAEIAADVAAALGFAHKGDVVHRDMKSGNVIVSPTGQVKVADFGIATAISGGAQGGLTQTGAVMGTATYFSPEQAQGKPLDGRSDLYALGVVMYEMLTGQPPFSGDNPVSIAYKHVQEHPPPIAALRSGVPQALQAITAKLLNKDPELRYPTAADLQGDLRRFQAGGHALAPAAAPAPVPAAPAAPPDPAPVGAPPPRAPFADPGYGGAPPGAPATQVNHIPGFGQFEQPPPRDPYAQEYYEHRDRRVWLWILATVVLVAVLVGLIVVLIDLVGGDDTTTTTDDVDGTVASLVTVPNVTAFDRDQAVKFLQDRGLEVGVLTSEIREDMPENRIISQDPAADAEVEKGSAVDLVFSVGPAAVEVPSVKGFTEEVALQTLSDAAFEVQVLREKVNGVAEGDVAEQDPEGGQLLDPGQVVTITVSEGDLSKEVINLEGQVEADAITLLNEAGWANVTAEQVEDLTFPEGRVVTSDPPPGTMHELELPIVLKVSSGPPLVIVRSVIGMTPEDAGAALELQGFVVIPDTKQVTDPGTETVGRIIDQLPAGGDEVAYGSDIIIKVGTEPPPTPTPTPTPEPEPEPEPEP